MEIISEEWKCYLLSGETGKVKIYNLISKVSFDVAE